MRRMRSLTLLSVALLVMLSFVWSPAFAKRPPPSPVACGLTGAWMGDAEGDLGWLAIHTSTDGITGQMLMNWTYNHFVEDPSITYEMMPGVGVWELTNSESGTYSFTWFSQFTNISQDPVLVVPIRVSGTAQMNGCDVVIIDYYFDAERQGTDGEEDLWGLFDHGTAYQYRMPIHTYTPPAVQ